MEGGDTAKVEALNRDAYVRKWVSLASFQSQ